MGEVFPGFQDSALLVDSLLVVLGVFTTAYLSCLFITPLLISFSPRLGLVDNPGPRAIHKQAMPRAGGIAIFISFHLSILVLLNSSLRKFGALDLDHWWGSFAVASLVIFLVGLIDDFKRLSAPVKLSGQIIASFIVYMSDIRIVSILGYQLPEPLVLLFTIIWFVIITNAFNLIDGLDGLASGLSSLAALGLAGSLIYRGIYVEAVLLIGFIGTLTAFLKFNLSPARIFLGDSGSNLCGFTLAFIMLSTGSKHLAFAQQWIVILIMAVPLIDTTLAIWRRSVGYLLNKSNSCGARTGVMTGDLEHIHHRLIKLGLQNRDVVAILYLVNAIFILVSLVSLPIPNYAFALLGFTALIFSSTVLICMPPQEIKQSALLIYILLIKPNSSPLTRTLRIALDLILTSIALIIAYFVCHPEISFNRLSWFWSQVGPSWVIVALAFCTFFSDKNKAAGKPLPALKILLAPLALSLLALNISLILPVKSWQALTIELSMFAILTILLLSTKKILLSGIQKFIESTNAEMAGG